MTRNALQCVVGIVFCVLVFRSPVAAAPVDVEFTIIDTLTHVGTVAGSAGFTLRSRSTNVGANPVPWGYPVQETKTNDPGGATPANPWVNANGFQGQEGAGNHYHTVGGPAGHGVGPHPHIQFYLYRQAAAGATTVKIGQSELKHTYRTAAPNHHELAAATMPGAADDYSIFHNHDQSFYGWMSEIELNPASPNYRKVAAHDHMGSPYPALGAGHHRDHGEPAFAGGGVIPADAGHPGVPVDWDGNAVPDFPNTVGGVNPIDDNIDHLLQAPLAKMMPAPGVRWFLAGTYFVVDDNNPANDSKWIEIVPAFNAATGQLTFTEIGGGFGLGNIPKVVPEPASATLVLFALLLVGWKGVVWRPVHAVEGRT